MDEWSTDESDDAYSTDRWESYSDLMAVMLMVFALVLSAIMLVSAQETQRSEVRRIELDGLRQEAANRMGVRAEIIEALRTSLAEYEVKVDSSTGAIRIGASVLFAQDEATVTDSGKVVLGDVMGVYTHVFFDSKFEQYLSRIIVEGHTNSDGEYLYNLELSQKRAQNVMRHIVSIYDSTPWENPLKRYMVASGRSEMDVLKRDGIEDKDASRRIEFKFSLKDEEMIEELQRMLSKKP
jgi:outer membrane protein OmpA-like peptidoglycan-associated protein